MIEIGLARIERILFRSRRRQICSSKVKCRIGRAKVKRCVGEKRGNKEIELSRIGDLECGGDKNGSSKEGQTVNAAFLCSSKGQFSTSASINPNLFEKAPQRHFTVLSATLSLGKKAGLDSTTPITRFATREVVKLP